MKTLFIAEKPSLASAIAGACGAIEGKKPLKKGSYWDIGDYGVTWYFGHMFQSLQPGDYDEKWKKWDLSNLPIDVNLDSWKVVCREPSKKKQINAIKKLVKQADTIVNAGDPDAEGQLLIDETLKPAYGIDPYGDNVKRLWVTSLTQKDLIAAIKNVIPNRERKDLCMSALARSILDFDTGMTFSRFFSEKAKEAGYGISFSVGRVQTPTLALVANRDHERKHFKVQNYYIPEVTFGNFIGSLQVPEDGEGIDSEGRLVDKNIAERILKDCDGKDAKVVSYKSQSKTTKQPLGFSLSKLQGKCSAFGFSAQKTLDIVQSLYETHKISTYPRTDCGYLPNSMKADSAKTLELLSSVFSSAKDADNSIKSAIWNTKEVDKHSHFAIVPTLDFSKKKYDALSGPEKKVFDLIAQNYIAQFYKPYKYNNTTIITKLDDYNFKTTGSRTTDLGWKAVYNIKGNDVELPELKKGDELKAKAKDIGAKKTTPPAQFTDSSLIIAMTNAYKYEKNPTYKKMLKESSGIGTEATRASMIEKLCKRGYLKRQGKVKLVSTTLGQNEIKNVPDSIKSVGLTAIWDEKLSDIAQGKLDAKEFLNEQMEQLHSFIKKNGDCNIEITGLENKKMEELPHSGEKCPKCEDGKFKTIMSKSNVSYLVCDNKDCDNFIGHTLGTETEGDGKECSKCDKGKMFAIGGKSKKTGKQYTMFTCNNCDNRYFPEKKVDPLDRDGDTCPKCGEGKLKTFGYTSKKTGGEGRALKCEKCGFADFYNGKQRKDAGKECPKCHKGKTITFGFKNKKSGKKQYALKCPACEEVISWSED